jgi:hypothetical protein
MTQDHKWIPKSRVGKITVAVILVLAIILMWDVFQDFRQVRLHSQQVSIGAYQLNVRIADDGWSRYRGLSDTEIIKENEGMLFLFDESAKHTFVMRNMNFDLDILWFQGERLVYIESYVPRDSQKVYYPSTPADTVLEVNAGWAEEHNLGIGASLEVLPS